MDENQEPSRAAIFEAIVTPYLNKNPPESWHLIDNADADDVRHALQDLILKVLMIRTLGVSPRIERLRSGDYSFGHDGTHRGKGTKDCPREPHHHHDDFCKYPTIFELQVAGIDPKTFKVRSRA